MENIRPIKNDNDLDWAITEIELYFDNVPEQGTVDSDRFDVLSALIEDYENKHYPIDEPEPIELLKSFMETSGRTQTEFAVLIGSKSHASEVMCRKRSLSLMMIRKISQRWNISADNLIAPYHLAR